jgi:kynurenine formamidase
LAIDDDFTFIDLTHTLSPDIPAWDNGCGFQNKMVLDYSDCTTDVKFRVQSLQLLAGMGTHMDAPLHCIPGAASISDIPLGSLITPCNVIDVSDRADAQYSLSVDDIKQFENKYGIIAKGSFVIVYTGWDKWWHEPEKYRNNLTFPCISKQAAEELLSRDIAGIGIDTLSPDSGHLNFPVHQVLLGAGKYIIENVANANQMNKTGDYLLALPIKIQGGTEAPIRLIGLKRK